MQVRSSQLAAAGVTNQETSPVPDADAEELPLMEEVATPAQGSETVVMEPPRVQDKEAGKTSLSAQGEHVAEAFIPALDMDELDTLLLWFDYTGTCRQQIS